MGCIIRNISIERRTKGHKMVQDENEFYICIAKTDTQKTQARLKRLKA